MPPSDPIEMAVQAIQAVGRELDEAEGLHGWPRSLGLRIERGTWIATWSNGGANTFNPAAGYRRSTRGLRSASPSMVAALSDLHAEISRELQRGEEGAAE